VSSSSAARPDHAPPDELLLARAARGERDALDQVLRGEQHRIYAICLRMTGNDADARDATQEAMLAICRGLRGFDRRSAFRTWVYRVTTNACLDELRRRSRRPIATDPLDAGERGGPITRAPDDAVAARLTLDAALARLLPEFRAALVLRELCGLDYAEIADVLDIPPGTVRSRIARARQALARDLGNPDPLDERPTSSP
jgi:RNA polymerase sigma-70 factor, ECF subfamily